MDVFYALNLIDFGTRVSLVSVLFLIFLKLQKMDKDIVRSKIFLKYDKLRGALRYILILSPLFLLASLLEYPEFRSVYGEESVHSVQDIFLLFFQIGVIYFLAVVYKAINMPRH
jgi:uncharacterized membrane protein